MYVQGILVPVGLSSYCFGVFRIFVMATDAAGTYASVSTLLDANNGYYHCKYIAQVVPGLQHQFSLSATIVPGMTTPTACHVGAVILYALHNNYSSSSGVSNNVFSFGSGLASEMVADSVSSTTIGAWQLSYTGATSGCDVILQGSVPLVGGNLNGDGSTPALVYTTPLVRQVFVVPSSWYGPSGYPDTVVVEIAVPFQAQPSSNPILNFALSLMCPNNGTTPVTQLVDDPQSGGSANVNIAEVGGNTVISTLPTNIAQINGAAVSPSNPLAIVATGTTKVDVEQVLGSVVSGSNPLPTSVIGTVATNIQQVLGATVSSSNPLPTNDGGGGGGSSAGTTPNNPMYVYPVS